MFAQHLKTSASDELVMRGREKYPACSGPRSLMNLFTRSAILANRSKEDESCTDKPIRATHFVCADFVTCFCGARQNS